LVGSLSRDRGRAETLWELYREAHTPSAWHGPLFTSARYLGLEAFSSVFPPDDVDFLETLDCPMYQDIELRVDHHELIRYTARTGKPLVMSTGMATIKK